MKYIDVNEVNKEKDFAYRAAVHFKNYPDHDSFGILDSGEFLAIRWEQGIVVVTIDSVIEPSNYVNILPKD